MLDLMSVGAFSSFKIKDSLKFYGEMGLNVSLRRPTSFHYWMAGEKKIITHYSQNIDSIEERVMGLSDKTMLIHGTIQVPLINLENQMHQLPYCETYCGYFNIQNLGQGGYGFL